MLSGKFSKLLGPGREKGIRSRRAWQKKRAPAGRPFFSKAISKSTQRKPVHPGVIGTTARNRVQIQGEVFETERVGALHVFGVEFVVRFLEAGERTHFLEGSHQVFDHLDEVGGRRLVEERDGKIKLDLPHVWRFHGITVSILDMFNSKCNYLLTKGL
jgi:hypothetical protein